MKNIDEYDWSSIAKEMHQNGYALIPNILSDSESERLREQHNAEGTYRKTIVMERYRFGLGEYKYFNYPLPNLVQTIRESLYAKLAPIANKWMQVLNIKQQYPETFTEFQSVCHDLGQNKPTVLILRYGEGGFNTLHQDIYGDIFFPIQAVLFLSEPNLDYTGGEFVLIQQTPRAQSKAIVLTPRKGDMLIFTTNFRPVNGSKGYYRSNMKHGVSEVHSGDRYTLGIIFHDALT